MTLKNSFVIASVMVVTLGLGLTATPLARAKTVADDPQAAVNAAYAKFKGDMEGKNADYIPALAKVDPNLFGIALVTVDGKIYTAGVMSTEVSILSMW